MLKFRDIVFLAVYLAFTLVGMTLIKMGANGKGRVLLELGFMKVTPTLILGILCYGISFLMYTVVISQMQISLAMPIVAAANSIAIVLIGLVIFKEVLNFGQLFGIGVVTIGVFIIGVFSK
ncbi:Multidrug transporter EmrE [Butyrivibrio sp. INlla18]|uniref:hypothetical protein n=1 Tax=Butyrivibrio sp. INlla18 TaxID=1520806 RepID=UPI000881DEBD|nr:hypothetical protein [Butyrivibrio sp. INlla18]SDA69954.1 Multidrug transporter EmrE [Butyrivibrio sp. INlla18]